MADQPVRPEHTTGTPHTHGGVFDDASDRKPATPAAGPGLAIIASKIEPPNLSGSVLTRPRLVGWLDQQKRARVMLVLAEAGYGKSTLLSDFSSRTGETCIWYRLETSDGDWITFISHLVAAMRREYPGFGEPTEALLRHVAAMGPTRDVVLATFLADLDTLGNASTVLILDDYHFVEGSDDVRAVIARMLERAPAAVRFVIASRGRPDLPLGRLAAQGRIAELTSTDLRFTRSEIEELFSSTYGQPLAQETCDIVEGRTEGWAASLQLVSASIATSRPSEVDQFIEALSGAEGPIYDFLAEEVLTRLTETTQRVLVHASLAGPGDNGARSRRRCRPRARRSRSRRSKQAFATSRTSAWSRSGDEAGASTRLHPLLRQFLEHQLDSPVLPRRDPKPCTSPSPPSPETRTGWWPASTLLSPVNRMTRCCLGWSGQ